MSEPQEPVIIRDDKGDLHEFPPGFDPKAAGEIVRKPQEPVIIRDDKGDLHEFPPGFDPKAAGEIVRKLTAAPGTGTWEDRGIGGKVFRPNSGATERNRVDNSLLGVPPELAVLPVLGVGRAVAGAGAGLAGRAVAGAKAVVSQATPMLKYEGYKHLFEAAGMPPSLAIPAAMYLSGYQKGAKPRAASGPRTGTRAPGAPAAAPAASQSAPVAPPMSAPVAAPMPAPGPMPAPAAAPVAPPVAPVAPPAPATVLPPRATPSAAAAAMPDQKALNEAALAARRASYQASLEGKAMPAPGPVVPASGKMKLTGDEYTEYMRLVKRGLKPEDAANVVKAARTLNAAGGATTSEAKAAISARRYKS